jgi:hypothetical protein
MGIKRLSFNSFMSEKSLTYNNTPILNSYVETFSANGNFLCPGGVNAVELLVVAGGGGGGAASTGIAGGGGGAGGLIYSAAYTVTPRTTYAITVGAGGNGNTQGGSSQFDNQIAVGGGYGGNGGQNGGNGGSGGGAGIRNGGNAHNGGSGTAGQGSAGGNGVAQNGTSGGAGGGGGAGGVGNNTGQTQNGSGGAGLAYSITGTSLFYAGGGGGGGGNSYNCTPSLGGSSIGGQWVGSANGPAQHGTSGKDGTGSGGGRGGQQTTGGGRGGNGIVIIKYTN